MANIKITDLTELSDPDSTDVLPIVDVGADVTKKVSVGEVVGKISGDVDVATDGTSSIASGAIVDADVNASAAIAGTKIDPDFGSQTVETTGVFSAAGGAEATPSIAFTGDLDTGIYSPGANQVAISTNGTGRLFVDASGKVGVGTASPHVNAKLAVSNGGAETFEFQTGITSNKNTLLSYNRSTLSWVEQNYIASAHTFNISGSSSEVARIDSDGKLLVGTITKGGPNADNLTVADSGNCGITIRTGNNNSGNIYFSDGTDPANENPGAIAYVHSDDRMMFYTASTERIRIDSSGNVGLGTSSPDGLLHVQGVSGTYPTSVINHSAIDVEGEFLRVGRSDSAVRYHSIYGKHSGTSSSNYLQFRVHDGSGGSGFTSQETVMTLTGQGRVGIGTTSPSERLEIIDDSNLDGFDGIKMLSNNQTVYVKYGWRGIDGIDQLRFGVGGTERARIDSSGRLLVGTSSQSGGSLLQVNDDRIRIASSKTPASASDTGTAGEICWDANYIYVCTATDTWKRAALSTW